MRDSAGGFGLGKALLGGVAVVLLLMVAFWIALIAIGAAVVFFLVRAFVRSVTGRGGAAPQSGESILIEPGHRTSYDNGNVIVLPIQRRSDAPEQ